MQYKHEILLIGPDTRPLVDVSEYLDEHLYLVAIAQALHPIDYILEHRQWHPVGAIVRLAGDESIEDFLPLFQAYPETSFLFLRSGPSDGGTSEVVSRYGGAIIDPDERSPQRLVEDLAALMFHHKLDRQRRDGHAR
jgi:hypothetical protein